jgi:hypothetical protein
MEPWHTPCRDEEGSDSDVRASLIQAIPVRESFRGGPMSDLGELLAAAAWETASETAATVRQVDTLITTRDLAPEELEALRAAGAWYAKYHAVRIAELADDPSAYAAGKREKSSRSSRRYGSSASRWRSPTCCAPTSAKRRRRLSR